jgi:hypothetical protein
MIFFLNYNEFITMKRLAIMMSKPKAIVTLPELLIRWSGLDVSNWSIMLSLILNLNIFIARLIVGTRHYGVLTPAVS